VFQKELCKGILNVTLWRVVRKLLHVKFTLKLLNRLNRCDAMVGKIMFEKGLKGDFIKNVLINNALQSSGIQPGILEDILGGTRRRKVEYHCSRPVLSNVLMYSGTIH
jgi:hypothetical protein